MRLLQAFFAEALESTAAEMEAFGEEVVDFVYASCAAALDELDRTLFGVRDGVVADEAAEKRTQIRKCASLAVALLFRLSWCLLTAAWHRRTELHWSKSCRGVREIQEKYPASPDAQVECTRLGDGTAGANESEGDLSYALAGARRTEKRRMVTFVRLCDVIIASTMRNVLQDRVDLGLAVAASGAGVSLCPG